MLSMALSKLGEDALGACPLAVPSNLFEIGLGET